MSAIFGFTFHIGRMTEVLTPDIYRAHCPVHDHSLVAESSSFKNFLVSERILLICKGFVNR